MKRSRICRKKKIILLVYFEFFLQWGESTGRFLGDKMTKTDVNVKVCDKRLKVTKIAKKKMVKNGKKGPFLAHKKGQKVVEKKYGPSHPSPL